MTFGEKLKDLRVASDLTQAKLADASHVPLGTVREYEPSKRRPLLKNAAKLADALGVSVEVFADCVSKGDPPPAPSKVGRLPRATPAGPKSPSSPTPAPTCRRRR
jgi:transcriptional regulator with XRE-family HTH domain